MLLRQLGIAPLRLYIDEYMPLFVGTAKARMHNMQDDEPKLEKTS